MGEKKDNSIAVALIGAAAVVIAALIAFWATRPKEPEPTLVNYTGTVKDESSKKPIRGAAVAITEDEAPPQRFATDSEGVFYARLSKNTHSMLLEVRATNYQEYSRRGPTVRTGGEDIFLTPLTVSSDVSHSMPAKQSPEPTALASKPAKQLPEQTAPQTPSAESELRHLRTLHNVSLIKPAESGRPLRE